MCKQILIEIKRIPGKNVAFGRLTLLTRLKYIVVRALLATTKWPKCIRRKDLNRRFPTSGGGYFFSARSAEPYFTYY